MQAIAKITTSDADVMVRPSDSSTGGSTSSARPAITSGMGTRFDMPLTRIA